MSTRTHSTVSAGPEQLYGMAIMAVAMLMLPLMDVIAKWLTSVDRLSPGQVALVRFVVQFLVFVPIIVFMSGISGLRPRNGLANLVRGALIGAASLLFMISVKYMPLTDALAVFFVEPLILTVLSAIVLKEKVGWRRGLAVVAGFVGALVVIRPSYALLGPISLLPLATATLFALYLLLNRRLSADDDPLLMQMIAGFSASVLLGLFVLAGLAFEFTEFSPSMPRYAISWLLLLFVGLISAGGHLLVVMAFRRAESSLLAPFQYFEIVTGTIFGLLLFGDFPDPLKWFGILIIVLSGLYTFWRERALGRR